MKKLSVRSLTVAVLSIAIFFLKTSAAVEPFKDVPSTYLQAKPIEVLQLQNIVKGYPDGTFKPDQMITRAEFLKMAFNDVGYSKIPNADKTPFLDVPQDSWMAPYVKKALEINVISANGARPVFNPSAPITRAEAIKIAFPISGISTPYYTDIDPSELFQDVRPTAWYGYLARAAKLYGIVSLKHPELFWAQHLMTRGDAAELIYELQLARQDGAVNITMPPGSTLESLDSTTSELINNPEFGVLLDVWKRINTDFYYKSSVNQDELVYGAIQGMVDKLGDQYTVFEEPSNALGLQQYLQGELEGIGTVINIVDDKLVIMKTLPDSPAEKANLQTGDVIVKINDQDVKTLTINGVLDLIRGDAGTTVKLTIQRNTQTLDVTLTRAIITFKSASGKMMNGIGVVTVTEFVQNSAPDFTAVLDELAKQSPKGYVLDLRGNPGGYLESSIQMLGHFITKDKTVVSTKTADGKITDYHADGKAELAGKPLIVLVDDGTASAAEIMAGALQDLKIGKLMGIKTFGKGSVQEINSYSDDSLLKISIAHWLTPNGRDINGTGLMPDVRVELDRGALLKGTDSQLQKALDMLNNPGA